MLDYKIIILGHSKYPEGIKSMLAYVTGIEDGIYALYLDDENDFNKLEKDLDSLLQKSKNTLIFCDIPGGSPHRIAFKLLTEKKYKVSLIVGAPPALIIDLVIKTKLIGVKNFEEMEETISEKMLNLDKFITYKKLGTD